MIENILSVIDSVFIQQDRYLLWARGVQASFTIAFFALLIGIAVGVIIAIVRVANDSIDSSPVTIKIFGRIYINLYLFVIIKIFNRIFKLYVSVVRGIPVVVQLMIFNFFILAASRNQILIGSLAFGFNSGAYVSEVFRGGILSIDKGQMEAGRSLGLGYFRTMLRITLPQAIKNSLPAFCNEFISLFKETSIAGMAAITDVTHVGNIIRGLTFNPAPLFFVALFYLIVVVILEFLVGKLERRLRKSDIR